MQAVSRDVIQFFTIWTTLWPHGSSHPSPSMNDCLMNPDLPALLRLFRTENVGPVTWRRLMDECGSATNALAALPERAKRGGRRAPLAIPDQDVVEREIEGVMKLGGRMVTLFDPDYPPLLAELPDTPPILSVQGSSACLASGGVGIVGARNASAAGMRFAESLATELSQAGVTVVSGLARGIDGAAHAGALAGRPFPEWGGTVAAIAGGLDIVYPQEHAALQRRIAEGGAVVTEAPLGTTPQARHFPRRNRLIAGLSLGTVVVEAAFHSGSLITAKLADAYSRQVFAVPGSPLDPRCRGSNNLLRNGARLAEGIDDILPCLRNASNVGGALFGGFAERPSAWGAPGVEGSAIVDADLDKARERVLSLLSYAPVPVDDLVGRCQFSVSVVLSALAELELAGRAEILPGGSVILLTPPAAD